MQNHTVWVITQLRKSNHITETLIMVHWLPVKYCIQYKMLIFAYKHEHDTSPVYLTDLQFPICASQNSEVRTATQTREQSKARSKKYRECVFVVAAPSLWNDLSFKVKQEYTSDSSNSQLKTYLFMKAFTV